jgi:hypothetical protein
MNVTDTQLAADTGAAMIGFRHPAAVSVRTVEDKLLERVSVKDFGAVCDGVADDTAAVQAAVNYCIGAATSTEPTIPRTLIVPGKCVLSGPIYINREVNLSHGEFRIIGEGKEAGFHTLSSLTMFDSNLSIFNGIDPISEMVTFENIRFSADSGSINAWVISEKFLRIKFESCFFWIMRCADFSTYAQTIYFNNCNIRNWPSVFFRSNGAYDISVTHSIIENGFAFMEIRGDNNRGAAGLRILDNVIEGNQGGVLKCTGATGVTIGFNHIEYNAQPDFNFNTGSLSGGAVLAVGNYIVNSGAPAFNWGSQTEVTSVSNIYIQECPNNICQELGTLHGDVRFAQNFTSIGDVANKLADMELPLHVGSMRGNGVLAHTRQTVPYDPNIWLDARVAQGFRIVVTDALPFVIHAPVSPREGQRMTLTVANASGGVLGTLTWDAVFKLASWVQPASGFSRTVTFEYQNLAWAEVSRTADVPN